MTRAESQRKWRQNHRDYINAKRREWRGNPKGKTCDCGEPATHCQGSDFICEHCFQMQKRYEASQARRAMIGMGSTLTVHRLVLAL